MKRVVGLLMLVGGLQAVQAAHVANPRYPWEEMRRTVGPESAVLLPELASAKWTSNVPEGEVTATNGVLAWKLRIDHVHIGYPSVNAEFSPALDLSRRAALSFRFRSLKEIGRGQLLYCIVRHGSGEDMLQAEIRSNQIGVWQDVVVDLGKRPWLGCVDKVSFFLCESDYRHDDRLAFEFRDFRLGEPTSSVVSLADGQAGASLWVGARGDSDSRVVMLPEKTAELPFVLHVDNRLGKTLPATAEVAFRFHDLFTGRETCRAVPLGREIASGSRARLSSTVAIGDLVGGYYHVLADVRLDGTSVLGIRKGSDDLYVVRPGEMPTYSQLSLRAGLTFWAKDLVHGGFMHILDMALPHTYDPLDPTLASYGAFIRRFALHSGKVCEGYEAGMPGLAIAAEAFRASGDETRQRFAEGLLWNACEAMLAMQDANGGVVTSVNELCEKGCGAGEGGSARNHDYSADQIAEWMRGLDYAALYYLKSGTGREKVARINGACAAAAEFLLRECRQMSAGVPGVLRYFHLTAQSDGKFDRKIHRERGTECRVYDLRILAGLSFTALVRMRAGETVPEEWWRAMDASACWGAKVLRDDGGFDWQCRVFEDTDCHTFLGNIYAGEGLFGAGLAFRQAGRKESSEAAFAAAHKAYRFVTDTCQHEHRRYEPPTEFWVGPYFYWLLDAWRGYVGEDAVLTAWQERMDRTWRVDRAWRDFLRQPGGVLERADMNGMLTVAMLGYLGIRQMEEIGKPWRLLGEETK